MVAFYLQNSKAMVKKTAYFLFAFMQIILNQGIPAQEKDTMSCEQIFESHDTFHQYLEKEGIAGYFHYAKAPVLLDDYVSLVAELYPIMCENGYYFVVADLIVDTVGNVKCVRFQPVELNSALKDFLKGRIFSLKFSPAMQNSQPVISYYSLVFNSTKSKTGQKKRIKDCRKRRMECFFMLPPIILNRLPAV